MELLYKRILHSMSRPNILRFESHQKRRLTFPNKTKIVNRRCLLFKSWEVFVGIYCLSYTYLLTCKCGCQETLGSWLWEQPNESSSGSCVSTTPGTQSLSQELMRRLKNEIKILVNLSVLSFLPDCMSRSLGTFLICKTLQNECIAKSS